MTEAVAAAEAAAVQVGLENISVTAEAEEIEHRQAEEVQAEAVRALLPNQAEAVQEVMTLL